MNSDVEITIQAVDILSALMVERKLDRVESTKLGIVLVKSKHVIVVQQAEASKTTRKTTQAMTDDEILGIEPTPDDMFPCIGDEPAKNTE